MNALAGETYAGAKANAGGAGAPPPPPGAPPPLPPPPGVGVVQELLLVEVLVQV